MKRALKYGFHLMLATLAVPWLTMMAAGLAYGIFGWVLSPVRTPQQFYSNYSIFLVVVVGALLAYVVTDSFRNGLAEWVWIPFIIAFLLRILDWRASASVLVGSGSFVEHFFTVDCQIENWREAGFASSCSDKLFLTPLFIGGLSYSFGAAIRRVTQRWHRPTGEAFGEIDAEGNRRQLVTTRFGAFLALAVTGGLLGVEFHAEISAKASSWTWLGTGFLPTSVIVLINVAFWGLVYWIGVALAFARLRKEEKALLLSFAAGIMLIPIGAILPTVNSFVHHLQTFFSLTAFIAALVIVVSWGNRTANART